MKAKKIVGTGSLLTALMIILKVGPFKILNILNLLLPLILSFKKNSQTSYNSYQSSCTSKKHDLSEEEAYEILDISRNASIEEIKNSYKKLILKNHPDHGGSKYIASKLNQAKELLLNKR